MLAVQGRDDEGMFELFYCQESQDLLDHLALNFLMKRRTPKEAKNAATVGGALHLKSNEHENL